MLHTTKQLKIRGFTLIELLVVIAIIGLLATIIAAPIQNARKKARDSKKIAEIKAVQLAIEQYGESNLGNYPEALILLAPTYMPILPAAAATSSTQVSNRDKYAYVPYLASGDGVQDPGVWFGYHLGAHLESYSQALDSDRDCLGASNDSDFTDIYGGNLKSCTFFPLSTAVVAGLYSNGTGTTPLVNYATGMLVASSTFGTVNGWATAASSDFSGGDNSTSTCNAITDCVFDVTGQI